jgi:hypothetical protein
MSPVRDRIMTKQSRKKKRVEKANIDKEFRKIAEKNLRKDRELPERLEKI